MIEADKGEGEEHGEEGRFGAKEFAHAEAAGRQIVFEFIDALLDTGAPVVIVAGGTK